MNDKIKGGLFGLLIGDALGVPYEFHQKSDIPELAAIDFEPPIGFVRSYPKVPVGTYSDDGAQALCLLDSLLAQGGFDLEDFAEKLLDWYEQGLWAVDGIVFDVGVQTAQALLAYKNGTDPHLSGNVLPQGKGNGALMRVLPLALAFQGDDHALVLAAHEQAMVTHGHLTNHVCCALYVLIARYLLAGKTIDEAYPQAVENLRRIYRQMPQYQEELEFTVRPDDPLVGEGTGYVVDALRSALMVVKESDTYAQAVRLAVALGNDTDTTACIAGGLAGIIYGYERLPKEWLAKLRGKKNVEKLLAKMG